MSCQKAALPVESELAGPQPTNYATQIIADCEETTPWTSSNMDSEPLHSSFRLGTWFFIYFFYEMQDGPLDHWPKVWFFFPLGQVRLLYPVYRISLMFWPQPASFRGICFLPLNFLWICQGCSAAEQPAFSGLLTIQQYNIIFQADEFFVFIKSWQICLELMFHRGYKTMKV